RGGGQTGWWPSITTIPSLLPARRGGPSAQPKGRGPDRVVALDHHDSQSPPRSAGRSFGAAEGEGLRPGGGPRSPRFPVSSPLGGEVLRRSRRGGAQTGWWPLITTIPSLLPARR